MYLCDTGIFCHYVWVASGLLVGFNEGLKRGEDEADAKVSRIREMRIM